MNMENDLKRLQNGLKLSIVKKKGEQSRTSSIAYSRTGKKYLSANITSDTNLLYISSEQAALVLAVHNNDFEVNRVVTMAEELNPQQVVSPLVLKIIIDHQLRTGIGIEYVILDKTGKMVFSNKNIAGLMPFYGPSMRKLSKIKNVNFSENRLKIRNPRNIGSILKKYAILGMERNFPTYDSASGYGAAVLTDKNNLYFGGQYSAFDKRMGLHSEMTAVINVLMSEEKEKITHLGLVSSKYKNEPCIICGFCRQFLSEIMERFNYKITFYCFAKEADSLNKYSIGQLLSGQWSSKGEWK